MQGLGFSGLGFRVQGLGFRAEDELHRTPKAAAGIKAVQPCEGFRLFTKPL